MKRTTLRAFRLFAMAVLITVAGWAADEIPPPADVAAAPADAETSESGLAWKILEAGDGQLHPGPDDLVVLHYTGWTTDGKLFHSSMTSGKPVRVPLAKVIQGWTEGVQLMVEGEKRRLWIPEDLAYGGLEGKPQGMLVFDIELLQVVPFPKAPPDVAAPPADAEVTSSGLASKLLVPGTGTESPKAKNTVVVHYTGWTTGGDLFDSSVMRGQAARFPLRQVIKGWTEGVQLMVVGEKRRFWIPEELAYKGIEGKPQGMLVFDVELLEIAEKAPN